MAAPKPTGYQRRGLVKARTAIESGQTRVLMEMAQGLGKTYEAAFLLRWLLGFNPRARILVLCNLIQVQRQNERRYIEVMPKLKTGQFFDGHYDLRGQATFASFQTMNS